MKEKIANLQPIQIEKMEYKINELVVKTLSGTLNIGLSTHTDEQGLHEKLKKEQHTKFDLEKSSREAD